MEESNFSSVLESGKPSFYDIILPKLIQVAKRIYEENWVRVSCCLSGALIILSCECHFKIVDRDVSLLVHILVNIRGLRLRLPRFKKSIRCHTIGFNK